MQTAETPPTSDPTAASILRVQQVLDALALHRDALFADAEESDRTGQIADSTTSAIRSAGGYRLAAGGAVGASGLVRLGHGIATAHPAAAWNTVVSHTNALLAERFAALSGFSEGTQPDTQWCGVYASPNARATASAGRPGTHTINGSWSYASNSDLADWALLNVVHDVHGAAFAVVPRAVLISAANWAALGMRATGSHTLSADQVQIPDHQLLPAQRLFTEDPTGPFALRVPIRLSTALGLAAVAVGTAEGMVAALADSIRGDGDAKRPAGMPGRGINRPGVAHILGDAASLVRSARATLFDTADSLDRAAATGTPLDPRTLTDARMMLGRVTNDTATAAHQISLIAGSRACLESDTVGRLWRDTHLATRHAALSPTTGFDLGARALGDPAPQIVAAAVGPLAPVR